MDDDRGLAALAAGIHERFCDYGFDTCLDDAAAFLGERGVFLPDGDCGHSDDATARGIELARQQAAEIARLREIEAAARAYTEWQDAPLNIATDHRGPDLALALRAALEGSEP